MWLNVVVSGDLLGWTLCPFFWVIVSKLTAGCRLLSEQVAFLATGPSPWGAPRLLRPVGGLWSVGWPWCGRERVGGAFQFLLCWVLDVDMILEASSWSWSFISIPNTWCLYIWVLIKRQRWRGLLESGRASILSCWPCLRRFWVTVRGMLCGAPL